MRNAQIDRKTKETDISLFLELDGQGQSNIETDCGFFNHMLTLFASHGNFNLNVKCVGDSEVDYHHTVEDIGIVLGQAFKQALGDKAGITRYGNFILPMDEALILCALDISGRSMLCSTFNILSPKVGDFDTELLEEFLQAFCRSAEISLHITQLAGTNSHHIIEGAFKALARAMAQAVEINPKNLGKIPSTKGKL
ncbi:MAG: imidazoleglycerol-phosphate dehydratase HisB [Clostridia bacterium]|nr:imidazoleglycerol-phosphate dehydratase HisB [Clostridia bacterium]